MTWVAGFNFRATSGYVTDASDETYVIGDSYPTTRTINGTSVTFGWESVPGDGTRNRTTNSSYAPELSGIAQVQSGQASSEYIFRVDLPAAGDYSIRLGAGDAGNLGSNPVFFAVRDTTTDLITQSQTTPTGFLDASLVDRTTAALWKSNNVAVTKTFSTTIFRFACKRPTSGSSCIAHIKITQAATSSSGTDGLTFGESGTLTGAGALSGTIGATFASSSALIGAGALAATSGAVFGESGALIGAGALSSTSGALFDESGTLIGAGALAGTDGLTFGESAIPDTGISGTDGLTFSSSATLLGDGALSGTGTFQFLGQAGPNEIVVPQAEVPAGRARRRTVFFIEIDGQRIECNSLAEALKLLRQTKTEAKEAIVRQEIPAPPPIITTPHKELRFEVKRVNRDLDRTYKRILRNIDVSLLARRQEEEDTLLLFL